MNGQEPPFPQQGPPGEPESPQQPPQPQAAQQPPTQPPAQQYQYAQQPQAYPTAQYPPQQYPYYPPPPAFPGTYYGVPLPPGNRNATASIITSIGSIVTLIFTVGFLAIPTLIASIISIILGVKGRQAVDQGRTHKDRDVATAGLWIGVTGVVLSIAAIVGWIVFIVWLSGEPAADPGDLASLRAALSL